MKNMIATLAAATLIACGIPASAQQLENKKTEATSGTVGTALEGRLSGANLSNGGSGPAAETSMPHETPPTIGRGNGKTAGSSATTKELFQH